LENGKAVRREREFGGEEFGGEEFVVSGEFPFIKGRRCERVDWML
jgi:hypothetical protein